MKWPDYREQDRLFWPQSPAPIDFTLRFEHLILSITPTSIFIIIALWYIYRLFARPVCTRVGSLAWVKLIFAVGLIAVEVASLAIWCLPSFRSGSAIGAGATNSVAAVALAIVIGAEHCHSLQSSGFLGFYVLLSALLDIVKARSYFLRTIQALAATATASAALKLALLALLEVPKRREIIDDNLRNAAGKEAVAGFWTRTLFVWLNTTFIYGFQNVLKTNDLSALGLEFSSKHLSDRLGRTWKTANQKANNSLLKACFVTFYAEFFYVIPPRLCFTGFTLAQPLYLRRVVRFIGETNPSTFVRTGLILSCVLIFFGLAASRSLYRHMNYRLVTMARGALIPHILRKTLNLPYSVSKESAAATLMSTDIEGIVTGIPDFHEIWAGALEVAIGLYLLSTVINQATFLIVVPVIASVIGTYYMGKLYAKCIGVWNNKIQERVALTTKALLQIKATKTIGLEGAVYRQITQSRLVEIASFKTVRLISGALVMTSVLTYTLCPILAIAGGLFWTNFDGVLTAVDAFTTLAIVMIVVSPLMDILRSYTRFRAIETCFGRMQKYFVLDEIAVCRKTVHELGAATVEKPNPDGSNESSKQKSIIEFKGVSVAPAADTDAILHSVSFAVAESQFAFLLGPVGSGKTTLLRAVLGEATILSGDVWCQHDTFAYCGQKPWLRNVSIRSNITASNPFEREWYDKVIQACCLESDLQQLAEGQCDMSLAGNNGANLSGGQRQRVALARSIYSRKPLLLLDDVLSGLDSATSQSIYSRLFGAGGLLRKSASTVIFATHSVNFLKAADQAIILNGDGTISVQHDPSQINLTDDFVAKMEHQDDRKTKTAELSKTEYTPVSGHDMSSREELKSRSRGHFGLYKYLSKTMAKWKLILWLVSMVMVVGTERFPEVFVRIWLEVDPRNNTYFAGYAVIGGAGFIAAMASTWIYFLNIVPSNAIRLHSNLLDYTVGAKLSFLTSTDAGTTINRFSQDMTILTQKMPVALYRVVYFATYLLYDVAIIVSAAQYSGLLVPFIVIVFYLLQTYYLRTSRQMRHLDIEAKAPLYTLFTETSFNGLEHIRAFGWQGDFMTECISALDYSQKPFYYMYAIQRWLELSMDLVGLFLALILICITTFFRQTTSQAAIGLSMLNLVTFSNMVNLFVGAWADLETSLGALARLRTYLKSTPQEQRHDTGKGARMSEAATLLPPQWPESGNVRFVNVSAKYQETGPVVLDNASLTVNSGQKVSITGRTGSGKSSLLLALLGLLEYSGTIEIDGIDMATLPKHTLRSRITTISQDAVLLEGSLRENLIPYDGQADDPRMHDTVLLRILERVGLSEVTISKGGLSESLSDMSLSEGQMQFLCLARAMLHNQWTSSKLVLMDEPTSNMDNDTDGKVQSLVKDFFSGCTVMTVSHRLDANADVDLRLEIEGCQVTFPVGEAADVDK